MVTELLMRVKVGSGAGLAMSAVSCAMNVELVQCLFESVRLFR